MALGGIAAVALIAAVAAGAYVLVRKVAQAQQEADFDRKVRARKQGWRYDGTRDGRIDYRFAGGSGDIAWTMWYDSDRGSESPTPRAVWTSENLRTQRLSLVILGRRRFALESGVFGRLLIGVVSGIAAATSGHEAGPDKAEFYESAVVLDGLGPAFAERFAVAVRPEMPRGWFDEDLQRRLLRWPGENGAFKADDAVEVTLGPGGLSITVRKMPETMACWQHLAELGAGIAARLAAVRA